MFQIDSRRCAARDRDQCMVAAMRPVETERWIMRFVERRSTMFAMDEGDAFRVDAKIGAQDGAQRFAPLLWPVVELPHMNLVIAQVLCYVGKRLCVRCSHPCMVPIVVPVYKRANYRFV